MEPCSIPSQYIADFEYLGTSLRKINDNFEILEQYACELETRVVQLTSALQRLAIPPPNCETSQLPFSGNNCDVTGGPSGIKSITETTCVTESREPINISFASC